MSKKLKRVLSVSLALNVVFALAAGTVCFIYRNAILNKVASTSNKNPTWGYQYSDNAQYAAYGSLFAQYPKTDVDITFVGDSLTSRCMFSEFYPTKKIANRGIGSDTSEGVLNRIDSIADGNPESVFLMIGINDLGHGISIETITRNVHAIIAEIRRSLPNCQIYLESVLPSNSGNIDLQRIMDLNAQYEEICSGGAATYVNLFSLFMKGADINEAMFSADGVHLNGLGYKAWIEAIEDYIN